MSKLEQHRENSNKCKKYHIKCDICKKPFNKLSELEQHREDSKKCLKYSRKVKLTETRVEITNNKECEKPKKKKKKIKRWAP